MNLIDVVDESWLQQHLDDEDLVLLDARKSAEYAQGHLPGARQVDPAQVALAHTDAESVRGFAATLATVFSALGIAARSRVVVYGQATEANAARVAWALSYAGHGHVALLNGGLNGIKSIARTSQPPAYAAAAFEVRAHSPLLTSADQIVAGLGASAQTLIDLRDVEEYDGRKSGARRKGRIPGAIHWDVTHELGTTGALAAPAELAARLKAAGIAPEQELVLYCGSGGRAARSFIALQQAGFPNLSIYPSSWSEWGNRDDLPIELATTA